MEVVKHLTRVTRDIQKDGDIGAVVVQIADTGDSSAVTTDRYRHVIAHGLGRIPVGCIVQLSNKDCRVAVLNSDENKIDIQFTAEHAQVNVRIW